MGAWYTTRERVTAAPDIKASAYATAQIDAAIETASRRVEKLCHRTFYPWTGTRYFDWPNWQTADFGRLWLDQHELVSLTTLESPVGTAISLANVNLEPNGSGPPYSRIELNRGSSAAFGIASTSQHAIAVTGVFMGCALDERSAGTLAAGISSSVTTLTGAGATYGVGDILRIGSERMLVTGRSWVTSGQTGTLAASAAAQSLAVSDGTAFQVGEELLIEAERVLIRDIAGNTLIVQRAWSGSTLAAHTGATIFYSRSLTVTRGALGTAAAAHSLADPILRHLPPGPVSTLATAYTLDEFFQMGAGYARTVGQGEGERQASGRALAQLEESVYGGYGRKVRMRAV